MRFTKMHGIGNDYVYINCLEETVENPTELAVKISDRHFGVGGDGLVLILPSERADFCMDMYNADGSRGEMCGNAIRCVAKYVYERGFTKKTDLSIDTLAGIKYVHLIVKEGKVSLVKVNMGAPEFESALIPVQIDKRNVIDHPLTVLGKEYQITCVSTGNPHCVVFMEEDVRNLDLREIGPAFEHHKVFPKRINTEFVNVVDHKTLRMRVWERGSGETLACGTGACAAAAAAIVNGRSEEEVTVKLLGGDLNIAWNRTDNQIYMTGPAAIVFDGSYENIVK